MPRIKRTEVKERPAYLSPDGTINLSKTFKLQPKQTELLQMRTRDSVPYIMTVAPQCLSVGGFRSGKLIDVDEVVPTKEGWKRNGDIIAGDKIFDEMGEVCNVLVAHTPKFEKTYRVHFDDGSKIIAGAEHLWRTSTYSERKNASRRTKEFREARRKSRGTVPSPHLYGHFKESPKFGIRTTEEIYNTQRTKHGITNHSIDVNQSLELPSVELPIDPYLLGYWLGDGNSNSGAITGTEIDVKEAFSTISDVIFHGTSDPLNWRVEGLSKNLRLLGVINNKHIPAVYLRASKAQRIALLQGLMDSGGSVDKIGGGCEWSQAQHHKELVDGVSELLHSLGIKHTFYPSEKFVMYKGEKKICPIYRTSWTTPVPCFRLKRKAERQKLEGFDGQSLRHYIIKVEEIEPKLMRCLTVDSTSHLYLVGKSMIPTHNTVGWLMYFIENYSLAYENCDILVLRRTFKELEAGCIKDFLTFVPAELYTYDQTKHTATMVNGSRVVFGHCNNNRMRDIDQYLGTSYAAILVDECGQFSPDAWGMLYSRNIVSGACIPNKHGHLPIPVIVGATNPLGPYYEYYRTVFVQKEPWEKPEGAKRDANGAWWVESNGELLNVYDPRLYAYQRSTAMDNPEFLKRDPGFLARMNSLPKAQRDKKLLGLDGAVEGQYFTNFDPYEHVIDLREDPDAIIWEPWQDVWGSQDWGISHACAAHLFTKAMVKTSSGDYKLKVVCFKEQVTTGGKTHKEWALLFSKMCKLPNGIEVKPKRIFFSHEKFSRQVSAHTPADEYSKELKIYGLPAVTRATQDRIGSASLMYNMLSNGELVILDTCKDIINAIPSMMRDPDNIDDCLKVETRGDDTYDSFRYGLFGQLGTRKRPAELAIQEHAKELDPLARHFYLLKMAHDKSNSNAPFVQKEQPVWMGKANL